MLLLFNCKVYSTNIQTAVSWYQPSEIGPYEKLRSENFLYRTNNLLIRVFRRSQNKAVGKLLSTGDS